MPEAQEKHVKRSALQLTKRELQRLLQQKPMWAGMIAAGIVLGVAGPFDTSDQLRLLPSVGYWTVLAIVTFLSGTVLNIYAQHLDWAKALPAVAWIGLISLAVGIVVSAEVIAFNWAVFGLSPARLSYSVPVILNTVVIACVVNGAIYYMSHTRSVAPLKAAAEPDTRIAEANALPKLIDRLPFEKRGQLLSLSVQDHYVEVTTSKGTHLVLMRLSDAMAEAGEGWHVHRSHWVAENAVAKVTRKGGSGVIKTVDGRDIPVSRSQLPKLKEAGLLP